MTAPRRSDFVPTVAVTLAVLLGLYVGVYYGTVEPTMIEWSMEPYFGKYLPIDDMHRRLDWSRKIASCFSPIHVLDRRMRPHVWEPHP